jgi:adenosylmethionine-8-amino-7-oxononanoate aminotransferase
MPSPGQRYWHPFADMAAVAADGELVLDRGDGAHVFDTAGNRYLDVTASLWYANVGWGRGEIADAVAAQLRKLPAYSNFGDTTTGPTVELAERLSDLAPVPGSKVFFTSGGSDSVDTATKLARRYWQLRGEPDRQVVVTRTNAYHGMHVGGTSLAGIDANRDGHGDLLGNVAHARWDAPESLRETIDSVGAERVAAFFCEPVIGAGGVLPPPPGYLEAVRSICRDAGVLFVADEVITGFGRIGGAWFASTRFSLAPDVVLGAKGLTSGYLPMGVVLVDPAVAEVLWQPGLLWRHGYTYSGHAAAAAAALANLDIIEREDLLGRALQLEGDLVDVLEPLTAHPQVSEVRAGTGVLAAVQLEPSLVATDPGLAGRVVLALRRAGFLTRALVGGALQVSPPFVTARDDLVAFAEAVRAALDEHVQAATTR